MMTKSSNLTESCDCEIICLQCSALVCLGKVGKLVSRGIACEASVLLQMVLHSPTLDSETTPVSLQ